MDSGSGDSCFSKDFCRILELSSTKWICYRRKKKSGLTVLGVCNGVDVWQQDVTQHQEIVATDFTKLRYLVHYIFAHCNIEIYKLQCVSIMMF